MFEHILQRLEQCDFNSDFTNAEVFACGITVVVLLPLNI